MTPRPMPHLRLVALTLAAFATACAADEPSAPAQTASSEEEFIAACPAGKYTCKKTACCVGYPLGWLPMSEADWDIADTIATFQGQVPATMQSALDRASPTALKAGVSQTWSANVPPAKGAKALSAAVERTTIDIELPWAEFAARLPAADWGPRLAGYKGGQTKVYQKDTQGRPIRQVERMVLNSLKCDFVGLVDNDMTKIETITYQPDSALVRWRVMYSDNGSTEMDVGTLEFRGRGKVTRVQFFSAHRIRALKLPIPAPIAQIGLAVMFGDFVRGYRDLVLRK